MQQPPTRLWLCQALVRRRRGQGHPILPQARIPQVPARAAGRSAHTPKTPPGRRVSARGATPAAPRACRGRKRVPTHRALHHSDWSARSSRSASPSRNSTWVQARRGDFLPGALQQLGGHIHPKHPAVWADVLGRTQGRSLGFTCQSWANRQILSMLCGLTSRARSVRGGPQWSDVGAGLVPRRLHALVRRCTLLPAWRLCRLIACPPLRSVGNGHYRDQSSSLSPGTCSKSRRFRVISTTLWTSAVAAMRRSRLPTRSRIARNA